MLLSKRKDFCKRFSYLTFCVVFIFNFLISTQVRLNAQSEHAPTQKLLFLSKRQGAELIICSNSTLFCGRGYARNWKCVFRQCLSICYRLFGLFLIQKFKIRWSSHKNIWTFENYYDGRARLHCLYWIRVFHCLYLFYFEKINTSQGLWKFYFLNFPHFLVQTEHTSWVP